MARMTEQRPATAAHGRPMGQYDTKPSAAQRVMAVLLAVTVPAVVGIAGYRGYQRLSEPRVDGDVVAYKVLSAEQVEIRVEVRKPAGGRAYCIVRARNAAGREVGKDVVPVDPDGTRDTRARATFALTTSERPVTGELAGCSPQPISKDPQHN